MRSRLLLAPVLALVAALALVVPAQASAESFPTKVSNYVSDHTAYFVAALVVAILLLLLVVSVTRRREEEKKKKKKAAAGGDAAPPA
ncbi:MAG TPA: hypothetical protein VHA54_06790, partial [Solirubrobacterales bacterium]|nr:hypothetical protein [Solirubrobacterales bacterium]